MTYAALKTAARALHLDIVGAFHPVPQDHAPDGAKTLLLLGPHGPGFWVHFTTSKEYNDGQPDPLDRWSKNTITPWAKKLGAQAIFPSDGPPYPPFIAWARRSGQAWPSPVGLLVHNRTGLFISYRAALALPTQIDLPSAGKNPCNTCQGQPCTTACPVGALTPQGYDVVACKAYLDTKAGRDCMTSGCLVRRTCPVSQKYGRLPEQSAFHMAAFNPK